MHCDSSTSTSQSPSISFALAAKDIAQIFISSKSRTDEYATRIRDLKIEAEEIFCKIYESRETLTAHTAGVRLIVTTIDQLDDVMKTIKNPNDRTIQLVGDAVMSGDNIRALHEEKIKATEELIEALTIRLNVILREICILEQMQEYQSSYTDMYGSLVICVSEDHDIKLMLRELLPE